MSKTRDMLPSNETRWQRLILGISAITLAIIGTTMYFVAGSDTGGPSFFSGLLWRVAIVLGLAWIAAPQLERLGWQRVRGALLVGIIIVVILYAIRPRLGAIAVLVLLAVSAMSTALSWFRKLTRS